MADLTGVTFSEQDVDDGVRAFAIHDAETGKNFAILSDGKPSPEKVRTLLLEWLEGVRKAT